MIHPDERKVRRHGRPPYGVAILHGGPGAPGTVAALAEEIADEYGVLEPIQTAASISAQVEELRAVLEAEAQLPASLIGWS